VSTTRVVVRVTRVDFQIVALRQTKWRGSSDLHNCCCCCPRVNNLKKKSSAKKKNNFPRLAYEKFYLGRPRCLFDKLIRYSTPFALTGLISYASFRPRPPAVISALGSVCARGTSSAADWWVPVHPNGARSNFG
jgi:hypothetical protein